jgi:hypothetical protein
MFKERLRAWYKKQGRLSSKAVYYRDGVGDSMYSKVLGNEVNKLESAYAALKEELNSDMAAAGVSAAEKLQITAVVVTKRHHTRFYPRTDDNQENCQPGTCVDSMVTHPCFFVFFLQSHHAIQGTARPTYYFVIRNDMDFTADQIQTFTNALCYTYVRCTLPVGYAPPAYYADQLCERARLYVKRINVEEIDDGPGRRLQRPRGEKNETKEERKARIEAYNRILEEWETAVADAWRNYQFGPMYQGEQSHGPWHAKLNDSMFWM